MKSKISQLGKSIFRDLKLSFNLLKAGNKMAKIKDNDFPHIDFENKIMYGVMQHIKHSDIHKVHANKPDLIRVWSCKLTPRQSKSFVQFIREMITPYEAQGFTHIKRLQKGTCSNGIILNGIICSYHLYEDKQELVDLFREYGNGDLNSITSQDLEMVEIPSSLPTTKELTDVWSDKYWPMAWKGNQEVQFLKHASINIDEERATIKKLLTALDQHTTHRDFNGIPVGTLIVDNNRNRYDVVVKSFDCRNQHPLNHSVLKGIQQVADQEKERRSKESSVDGHSNYLLNDLSVYTTHEPCVMCSMALVHSRIEKIVYLKPTNTGGLESNYQLGDRDGLNWKFQIWKWLDEEDLKFLDTIEHNYSVDIESFNA